MHVIRQSTKTLQKRWFLKMKNLNIWKIFCAMLLILTIYICLRYINITYKITKTISTFHCLRTNTKHLPLITLQFLHFRHVLNALRLYNFRCEFTTVCLQETTFIVFIATMCAPLQENSRQQRTI